MKVIQINAVSEYSSTGRTTSELHDALIQKGHESWIAAPNVPNGIQTIKIGSKLEIGFHGLFSRSFGRQGYASVLSTWRLISKLKKINPDIVHLRNLHANFINLHLLFCYLRDNNVPTVITLHDCWPFTGHCCYFIDSNCDKWKKGCGKCPDIRMWNTSWFFDFSRRNLLNKSRYFSELKNLGVIGVSDWVTNFARDSILKNATIIKRIYNWIDIDKFRPSSSRMSPNPTPIILGVSQIWNRQKGLEDFIKLATMLPDCKFMLVGKLIEYIEDIPLNINFIGTTSSVDQLIEYYNKADVFFNPSTRETFGKVTAEALACGLPVVAYNATATPELVGSGCGYIVTVGDIDAAKDAVEKVLKDKTMAKRAREYAVRTFDKSKLVDEYIEVYQALIDNRNRI